MEPYSNLLEWMLNFKQSDFNVNLTSLFTNYRFKPLIVSKISLPDRFTGKCRCFDEEGFLVYEGFVKNNKREGQGVEYSKKGTMVTHDGFFEKDKPVIKNRQIYNEDGKLIYSGQFTANQEPECGVVYDTVTSKIKYAGFFKDCKLDGDIGYMFNEDGRILCAGKWSNGYPLNEGFRIYYKSGKVLYRGFNEKLGKIYHDNLIFSSKFGLDKLALSFSAKIFADEKELIKSFADLKIIFSDYAENDKNLEITDIKLVNGINIKTDYYLKSIKRTKTQTDELEPNIILKYNPKDNNHDIYVLHDSNLVFRGIYDNGKLKDGLLDYDEDFKVNIDLKKNKFIGDQYIAYNGYNYFGNQKKVIVDLEYKKYSWENKEVEKVVEILFLPKIRLLDGYFKVSKIIESYKHLTYMNANFEYIGNIRNFMRYGYGILYKDNQQIEAEWEDNMITGFTKVKLKNTQVMIGRMNKYPISSAIPIDYRKIVENCHGIPKNYNEENGKLEIVSNMEKSSPDKRFTLLFYPNGQLMYCGNFTDDGPNGNGASFDDDKGRWKCRRFGQFKDGQLSGENCYDHTDGVEKFGRFYNGEYLEGRNYENGTEGLEVNENVLE